MEPFSMSVVLTLTCTCTLSLVQVPSLHDWLLQIVLSLTVGAKSSLIKTQAASSVIQRQAALLANG